MGMYIYGHRVSGVCMVNKESLCVNSVNLH